MSCLSSMEYLTCQQICRIAHSGKVALWGTHSILLRRRNGQEFYKLCRIHTSNIAYLSILLNRRIAVQQCGSIRAAGVFSAYQYVECTWGCHWCAILLMSCWSRILQYLWILQYYTVFYNICRFTYIQKLQYSSVEGSRGWQGNCQVDTSSHRRNHHYRHNTICCWCYMMVWGSQKVVVHGGAGGQRVCNAMDAAIMHVPHKSCTMLRDCPRCTSAVNLN